MVGNGDYMLAALKRYFGFDSFRPGQEEAVGAVISGRDVMAVMPTGGGKSVCYQLPAARPGTFTLVVTPLRALMRDQVRHLRSRGIPAALIDSGLDEKERAEVYGRALSGELRILYVAPERLHAPDFADFSHRIRISLLAVDEAHCVLHWGSDFRPSYMRIGEFIDSLSPRPVTMALTATASRTQAGEIRELLHLADPVTVTTDADRPNLRLTVVRARPGRTPRGHDRLGETAQGQRHHLQGEPERLRTARRDTAFRRHRRHGVPRRNEGRGQETGAGRVPRRPSARHLRHQRVRHGRRPSPTSDGSSTTGRAKASKPTGRRPAEPGRDGKPARRGPLLEPRRLAMAAPRRREAKSRAEESGDPSRIRAAQLMDSRLDAMSAYCETRRCLRRTILAMFDPPGTRRDDCSNCSNCQADGREIVKKPASNPVPPAADGTGNGGGTGRAHGPRIDPHRMPVHREHPTRARPRRQTGRARPPALHGSTRRSVTEQGLELIDGHGAFATRSRPAVRNMIGTLEAIQAIDTGTGLVEPGPLFDIYLGGDR